MSKLSTPTETALIEPIHPGEVLMKDFIEGFGTTQNKPALSIGVPPRRINEIVHGKRGITAETALRCHDISGHWLSSGLICIAPTSWTAWMNELQQLFLLLSPVA